MAKRKTSKAGMLDQMPNRKYVTVTWAAAATTAVYTQFNTMMGAREGAGWLISRVDVMFGGTVPPTFTFSADQSIRFQVCTGAQVATLSPDDDEVIATIDWTFDLVSSGAHEIFWPLTWVGPVLVASRDLSCVMDAAATSAPFQDQAMIFTIWYQWVQLGAREWVEIAEARGIA